MVLWLRLHTSTAGNLGSISGQQTKIQDRVAAGKKKKNGIETPQIFLLCNIKQKSKNSAFSNETWAHMNCLGESNKSVKEKEKNKRQEEP